MGERALSVVSEFSPQHISLLTVYSQNEGLSDRFSYNDIFSLMTEKMHEMATKLQRLGIQYYQFLDNSKVSRLRSFSRSTNEEHLEILNKKENFIGKLTDAVEISDPIGVPKYRIQCNQELSSILYKRFYETQKEVGQHMEEFKKLKYESNQLDAQISIFENLSEEQSDLQEPQESIQARIQFQEAKKDLDTILTVLCPKEGEKKEFVSAILVLIDAYVENLDCKEDQFVEISPKSLKNRILLHLIKGSVIVRHPLNPKKVRLFVED